jgi:hypothetical protein
METAKADMPLCTSAKSGVPLVHKLSIDSTGGYLLRSLSTSPIHSHLGRLESIVKLTVGVSLSYPMLTFDYFLGP